MVSLKEQAEIFIECEAAFQMNPQRASPYWKVSICFLLVFISIIATTEHIFFDKILLLSSNDPLGPGDEFNTDLLNHIPKGQDMRFENLFVDIFFTKKKVKMLSCQANVLVEEFGLQGFCLASLRATGPFPLMLMCVLWEKIKTTY